MGGAFDITQFLDGYFDQDCYFLNPPDFLPGLSDAYFLDQFRRNKWVLVTGEHDICRAANEQFSRVLAPRPSRTACTSGDTARSTTGRTGSDGARTAIGWS